MATTNTAITSGVRISVSTQFRPDLSDPLNSRFFFNYRVTIENENNFPVTLLHRDWYIFDSLNEADFVSGEGVVGEQPNISPEKKFTYISGCELHSEIGQMKGFYTFRNEMNGDLFQVHIPQFDLIYPAKLN
jgi:ApaG protein